MLAGLSTGVRTPSGAVNPGFARWVRDGARYGRTMTRPVAFGLNVDPNTGGLAIAARIAAIVDAAGLEYAGVLLSGLRPWVVLSGWRDPTGQLLARTGFAGSPETKSSPRCTQLASASSAA
jgi:hypothetical protein